MPRGCLRCKFFLLADEPLIVHYELKTADWACALCGHCFPASVESTVQEVDGKPCVLCLNCWEDSEEYRLGIEYLKQRDLELEAVGKKKKAAKHG